MTLNEWKFLGIFISFIVIGSLLVLTDNLLYIGIPLVPWSILMVIYGRKIEKDLEDTNGLKS
jgi:hypothetical protein